LHDTRRPRTEQCVRRDGDGVDDFDAAVAGSAVVLWGLQGGGGQHRVRRPRAHVLELGIETGVDLDRLIETAREAEKIVGHDLPGKLIQGTPLKSYRGKIAA